MAISDAELKQNLLNDVTGAQQQMQRTQTALGAPPPPEDFNVKAVRVGNKAFAQKHIQSVNDAFNRAIQHLTDEAGIGDAAQKAQFQRRLQGKLNQFKILAMQQAGQQAKQDLASKISAQQKADTLAALTSAFGTTASSIIGNIGVGKKAPTTTTAPGTVPGQAVAEAPAQPQMTSQNYLGTGGYSNA